MKFSSQDNQSRTAFFFFFKSRNQKKQTDLLQKTPDFPFKQDPTAIKILSNNYLLLTPV